MLDYLDFWYVHKPTSLPTSKMLNLQYPKNEMLDCHDFIPHECLFRTTINWVQ